MGASEAKRLTSGIYSITNLTNGHRYVGSSADVGKRWQEHRNALHAGRHHNAHLQNAWARYGPDAFILMVILECPEDMLLDAEQSAIDGLTPEYNICHIAGSARGLRRTEETRARMSAAAKARGIAPETRAKINAAITGMKRKPRTAEHQAKLNAAQTGRTLSEETRAKISAAHKGRPLSRDHRAKLSAALMGRSRQPK